jgi:ubiquinol-cytochrome c reductase cytochrome c subunit
VSAPLLRWLRRPSRVPRTPRALFALVAGALSIAMLVSAPAGSDAQESAPGLAAAAGSAGAVHGGAARAKSPYGPGPGEPRAYTPTSPALVAEGRTLFTEACAACHGADLRGRPGIAPSLIGVGAGPTDFYLSTGRMPLSDPRVQPLRAQPHFKPPQIQALVAYVASFGGPPAPTAEPAKGSLALGFHAFTLDCAGCHQIVARGGLTVGAFVPDLQSATPLQIAEAVRMGPYVMPHFDTHQIDQHELDSIARYVLWTRNPSNRGGWGIYNLGPIPEGLVAWFLGLVSLLIVIRLIGERTT